MLKSGDAALIYVDEDLSKYMQISDIADEDSISNMKEKDDVTASGYPAGKTHNSAVRNGYGDYGTPYDSHGKFIMNGTNIHPVFYYKSYAEPGMSGSPVMNKDNKLIGIHAGILDKNNGNDGDTSYGFTITKELRKDILKAIENDGVTTNEPTDTENQQQQITKQKQMIQQQIIHLIQMIMKQLIQKMILIKLMILIIQTMIIQQMITTQIQKIHHQIMTKQMTHQIMNQPKQIILIHQNLMIQLQIMMINQTHQTIQINQRIVNHLNQIQLMTTTKINLIQLQTIQIVQQMKIQQIMILIQLTMMKKQMTTQIQKTHHHLIITMKKILDNTTDKEKQMNQLIIHLQNQTNHLQVIKMQQSHQHLDKDKDDNKDSNNDVKSKTSEGKINKEKEEKRFAASNKTK